MKLKSSYDIVVVGSSPLMLIEAYFLAKQGHNVLIVEKNKNIGGSWQTFSYKNLSNQLEIGCHVWYRDRRCFKFLNDIFDLDIKPQNFQPKVYRNGVYLPYYFINFFVLLNSILFISSIKKLRQFKSTLICFLQDLFNLQKFQYPISGSYGFLQKILLKIQKEQVDIIFNKEILKIDIPKKYILLSDEVKLGFKKQIVLSVKSQIKTIVDSKMAHNFDHEISRVCNLYIILKNKNDQKISYVGVWGDDVIYRVSDITYNDIKLAQTNQRLLCVQVLEHHYKSKEKIIIDKLIKMKIIDSVDNVKTYFWKKHYFNNSSNDLTMNLNNKFSPYLRYLSSHNLIKSFNENYYRWKKITEKC